MTTYFFEKAVADYIAGLLNILDLDEHLKPERFRQARKLLVTWSIVILATVIPMFAQTVSLSP